MLYAQTTNSEDHEAECMDSCIHKTILWRRAAYPCSRARRTNTAYSCLQMGQCCLKVKESSPQTNRHQLYHHTFSSQHSICFPSIRLSDPVDLQNEPHILASSPVQIAQRLCSRMIGLR